MAIAVSWGIAFLFMIGAVILNRSPINKKWNYN
jgi:hypothetical protein